MNCCSIRAFFIFIILISGANCDHRTNTKKDDSLFKHLKVPHPDKDNSEFGKIYSVARKKVRNRFAGLLNDIGETNFETLENVEAYRIIDAPDHAIPLVVSVIKEKDDVELKAHYPGTVTDKIVKYENEAFKISQAEFTKFSILVSESDLRNYSPVKRTPKQFLQMRGYSYCYVEGMKNGKYFEVGEYLSENRVFDEVCSYWEYYSKKAQFPNNNWENKNAK